MVRAEAMRRGIERLCHFTPSRKLPHILADERGIRSVAELEADGADTLNQNDPLRLEGDAIINCSIEYPNTWLLDKMQDREKVFPDWVVLLLDPSLLWRDDALFTPRNAASGVPQVPGIVGFNALFAELVVGAGGRSFRRTTAMLVNCPTDGQAEVLIPRNIDRSLIRGIAVASEAQAETEIARLGMLNNIPEVNWFVAPGMFSPNWVNVVRAGRRPNETRYVPGTERGR
jgi:hypothetical protein